MNVDDLYNITHGKARRMDVVETVVDKESVTGERQTFNKYMLGEHVIAYQLEGYIVRWYLGIVEAGKSEKLLISFMVRADSKGQIWVFPEIAEILETSVQQIAAS